MSQTFLIDLSLQLPSRVSPLQIDTLDRSLGTILYVENQNSLSSKSHFHEPFSFGEQSFDSLLI